MTSEARGRALTEDDGVLATEAEQRPDAEEAVAEEARAESAAPAATAGDDEPAAAEEKAAPDEAEEAARPRRTRLSVPLVPVLAVLLVLLLGATAWLWFTRAERSSVTTGDYAQVLQAARSEVVDLTSFDYLTLDDDIAQARRITTGDLQKEAVAQLNDNRRKLTDSQAVVDTQVVGAAVTQADAEHGSVLLVIQSTQKTSADQQAQVVRYRIQAELTKVDGRWLLSGLSGR